MTKITSLTAKTSVATMDNLPIVDNDATPTTKKVTWANAIKSIMTQAKGSIPVSDGTTIDDLVVGTDGYYLVADSAQTLGIKWAAFSGISESSEASSTPVSETGDVDAGDGKLWLGNVVTLPTTEKYYRITAVEWKNGATVSGNVIGGVALIDAQPPVSANLMIVAQTPVTAQSGTSAVQKVSVTHSLILAGGTSIVGWLMNNNATGTFRYNSVGSQNVQKSMTFPTSRLPMFDTSAWNAASRQYYVKIYYKGLT